MIACSEKWPLTQPIATIADRQTVTVAVHDLQKQVPVDTDLLAGAAILQAGQQQSNGNSKSSVIQLQECFDIAGLLGCLTATWSAQLLQNADLCSATHVASFLQCTRSYSALCDEVSKRLGEQAFQQLLFGLPTDVQSDVAKMILLRKFEGRISEGLLEVLPPTLLDLAIRAISVRLRATVQLRESHRSKAWLLGGTGLHFLSALSGRHPQMDLEVTVVGGDVSWFVANLPKAVKRLNLDSCQVYGVKGVHMPAAFPDLDELCLSDCEFVEDRGRDRRSEKWCRGREPSCMGVCRADSDGAASASS